MKDTLLHFRREEEPFLRYFVCVNVFDSVVVYYKVGELTLTSNSMIRHIPLDYSGLGDAVVSDTVNEVQTNLLPLLRSTSFTISSTEDSLQFYRQFNFIALDTAGNRTQSFSFQERTEFTVQLRKLSNDSVLLLLDSIGYHQTYIDTTEHISYGDSKAKWCRSIYIPQSARGVAVYLQIVPKRWGSTAYGISASTVLETVAPSAYYSCGDSFPTAEAASALNDKLFAKLVAFWTAQFSTYCTLPGMPKGVMLTRAQSRYLKDNFMIVDTIHNQSDTIWKPAPCDLPKQALKQIQGEQYSRVAAVISARGLDREIELCVHAPTSDEATVTITNVGSGQQISRTLLRVDAGKSCYYVPFDGVSGTYLISAHFPDTKSISNNKVVIVR